MKEVMKYVKHMNLRKLYLVGLFLMHGISLMVRFFVNNFVFL